MERARQQPDKVRRVLEKIRGDGLLATLTAVRHKLDQPLALGYFNVGIVQEESTFLGVLCLTLRTTTERPVTVTDRTNKLTGARLERLYPEVTPVLSGHRKSGWILPLWEGWAAERIAQVLAP